jgi:hypothetical protein
MSAIDACCLLLMHSVIEMQINSALMQMNAGVGLKDASDVEFVVRGGDDADVSPQMHMSFFSEEDDLDSSRERAVWFSGKFRARSAASDVAKHSRE